MNLMNPSVVGYELERAIECVNGDWHFIYDAAPVGYAGLKMECVCNALGEVMGEFYRVAGRTFFCPDLAAAAWHGAYDYRVSDLREQPEGGHRYRKSKQYRSTLKADRCQCWPNIN